MYSFLVKSIKTRVSPIFRVFPAKIEFRPDAQLYIFGLLQFKVVIEIQSIIENAVHIHRLIYPPANRVCKGSARERILGEAEGIVQKESGFVQHIVSVQPHVQVMIDRQAKIWIANRDI